MYAFPDLLPFSFQLRGKLRARGVRMTTGLPFENIVHWSLALASRSGEDCQCLSSRPPVAPGADVICPLLPPAYPFRIRGVGLCSVLSVSNLPLVPSLLTLFMSARPRKTACCCDRKNEPHGAQCTGKTRKMTGEKNGRTRAFRQQTTQQALAAYHALPCACSFSWICPCCKSNFGCLALPALHPLAATSHCLLVFNFQFLKDLVVNMSPSSICPPQCLFLISENIVTPSIQSRFKLG
ncbi:hypothetical protein DFH06DRAFT_645783 [Mycena polygramma]|nr:hypothetical protein DFH06DRAFT_645783 [Mycena polygramma]